jgi:hypothetical protein
LGRRSKSPKQGAEPSLLALSSLMLVFVGLSVSFVEYGRAVAACIGGTGVKRNAGIVGILFAVHFAVLVTSLSAGRQSF